MSNSEDSEIGRLLEGVFERYGFDFRTYAIASMRRRVLSRLHAEKAQTVAELRQKVLGDPECMERLLLALTVHVTSMFRDPAFYVALRTKVVPLLRTYPFIRVWHAGCSTGEEVYSMAILLEEEGIYERCRIYATDISDAVLRTAKAGLFPLSAMKEYTQNYIAAGGSNSFCEYYTANYEGALFRPSLRRNVAFAAYNLATDASFNEFNLILCRNVMIYFGRELQDRAHGVLYKSLDRRGVLALGRRESLRFTPREASYEAVDETERIYRRTR